MSYPPQRSAEYIRALHKLCQFLILNTNNMGIMVEVGSFAGESTKVYSEYFETVFAVDPWIPQLNHPNYRPDGSDVFGAEEHFDLIFKDSFVVQKLKMKSEDAYSRFEDESLDFVYLDGLHDYDSVAQDIKLWYPKVKPGSHIGGHDYLTVFPGVIKAVNEFFGEKMKDVVFFEDTSWLIKKL